MNNRVEKKNNINILTEAILNELALIGQEYNKYKKVYDAAFKKGLPLWEKKAKSKGYTPCDYSDAVKYFEKKIDWKDETYMIKDLNKVKVGKWTLLIGQLRKTVGAYYYDGDGRVAVCKVIVRKSNGKCALRDYPYKRYLNWKGTELKG